MLALFVLLVVKVITTSLSAYGVYRAVSAARSAVQTTPLNPQTLSTAVEDVGVASGRLIAEIRPLLPAAALFGADGCVAVQLVELGRAVTDLRADFASLAAALPDMSSAAQIDVRALRTNWDSQQAQAALNRIEALDTPPCEGASPRFARFEQAGQAANFALRLLFTIPWDTVLQDSAHWLIVLNNSDELRATGGFTTAVIDLRVTDGYLTWNLLNSYAVDDLVMITYHPRPPQPMMRVMNLDRWMFRDANWSPDYPTTAENAIWLYQIDHRGDSVDGYITINLSGLATALNYLPPVTFAGEPFTADDGIALLRDAWNVDASDYNSDAPERKEFIFDFADDLISELGHQLDPLDLLVMLKALPTMLEQRDIMVYASDPTLQTLFAAHGWDGSLIQTGGDYLLVVDSNIGYNKVTPRIERVTEYELTLSETVVAQVTLTYTNTNENTVSCALVHQNWGSEQTGGTTPTYADRMTGCYWNYVRIFVPQGSQMLDYDAEDLPGEVLPYQPYPYPEQIDQWRDGGYMGFGVMTVIPPAEARTIRFRYQLPDTVITHTDNQTIYHFTMQQQAGAANHPLHVRVQLPAGASVDVVSPVPFELNGEILSINIEQDRDLSFEIRLTDR